MTDTRYHPPMPEREPETPPAPRPTCGTCPHWDTDSGELLGDCTLYPPSVVGGDEHPHMGFDEWCGQHPDMPAWIRDEWPKVKR